MDLSAYLPGCSVIDINHTNFRIADLGNYFAQSVGSAPGSVVRIIRAMGRDFGLKGGRRGKGNEIFTHARGMISLYTHRCAGARQGAGVRLASLCEAGRAKFFVNQFAGPKVGRNHS